MLENRLEQNPTDEVMTKLMRLWRSWRKKRIEQIELHEKIIESIISRSKANWFKNGEGCPKFFCSLEKIHFFI